jgi:hypothetical protein
MVFFWNSNLKQRLRSALCTPQSFQFSAMDKGNGIPKRSRPNGALNTHLPAKGSLKAINQQNFRCSQYFSRNKFYAIKLYVSSPSDQLSPAINNFTWLPSVKFIYLMIRWIPTNGQSIRLRTCRDGGRVQKLARFWADERTVSHGRTENYIVLPCMAVPAHCMVPPSLGVKLSAAWTRV